MISLSLYASIEKAKLSPGFSESHPTRLSTFIEFYFNFSTWVWLGVFSLSLSLSLSLSYFFLFFKIPRKFAFLQCIFVLFCASKQRLCFNGLSGETKFEALLVVGGVVVDENGHFWWWEL